MFQNFSARIIGVALATSWTLCYSNPVFADNCGVANVLFGKTHLQQLPDTKSALVRSATFDNPAKNYDALLGEITVAKGNLEIHDANQVVVGAILPDMTVQSFGGACNKHARLLIKKAARETYIILSGNTPVGTVEGAFPKPD